MKYSLQAILLVFFLCICTNTAAAKIEITVYGDNSYPPYSYIQNGTAEGIYVRILETAFSRMPEYEIKIELQPWKRALLGIKCGKYFAIFPPYYRPDKRPWMSPYSTPILEEGYSVYCRREVLNRPRPNWPDDYKGLQIGTNLGYSVPRISEMKYQSASSTTNNLKKLLQGKIDCYASNSKSILYALKQIGADSKTIQKGTDISIDHGYLAFSATNNPPYKVKFINKFNSIIEEMKLNGEINAIVDFYIK
jgi:polar amino acid transport system substrate-binding protein